MTTPTTPALTFATVNEIFAYSTDRDAPCPEFYIPFTADAAYSLAHAWYCGAMQFVTGQEDISDAASSADPETRAAFSAGAAGRVPAWILAKARSKRAAERASAAA